MSILAALEQAPRLKRDDRGRVREKLFTDFPFDVFTQEVREM